MKSRPSLEREQALWAQGFRRVAGLDEAGRGAWAGPVVAAAVILPPRLGIADVLEGVTDSKQLTPNQRQVLRERITAVALSWGIGHASAEEIDQLGILPATRLAMKRALQHLIHPPDALLIDAVRLPDLALPQHAFPFADALSLSVAAASILAKTERDAVMIALDREQPGYGFAQHKGYGTRAHAEKLRALGPSVHHRRCFKPVDAIRLEV